MLDGDGYGFWDVQLFCGCAFCFSAAVVHLDTRDSVRMGDMDAFNEGFVASVVCVSSGVFLHQLVVVLMH